MTTTTSTRAPGGPDLQGAPLGPGSLTWRHFGDTLGLLLIGRTGVLQTMHPAISQALLDHSDYFADPIDRIARSAGPILGVVYDEAAGDTGHAVRDRHRGIRSDAPSPAGPRGYRALDPEVFFWAHATFFEAMVAGAALFHRPLSTAQLDQAYAESITWYRRYGMSMAPVPRTYPEFTRYWDHTVGHVLQATPVAAQAIARSAFPVAPPGLPPAAWKPVEPLFAHASSWITRGLLPPAAREVLGIGWGRAEQRAFGAAVAAVRAAWPLAPVGVRMLPRAAAAFRRTGTPIPGPRPPLLPRLPSSPWR